MSRRSSGGPRGWPLRVGGVLALLAAVVALGPRETFVDEWLEPDLTTDVEAYLAARERAVVALRPGDERALVWAGEPGQRTPVSLVYLHGFSADRHETEPLTSDLAAELGANAYFPRLTGHGRDGDAMAEATVEDWLHDTAEAVAVGGRIGERVVLVGTSTGGTLALWAAAQPEAHDRVAAVVLISPNFQPADRTSRVLLYPWGGAVARMVTGSERCFVAENERQEAHWTTCYPTSALLPMMALVEHVRTMRLADVEAPVLIVYSPQDRVVDASETLRVAARLPREARFFVPTEVGDPANHVVAGDILSPGSTRSIHDEVLAFLEASGIES